MKTLKSIGLLILLFAMLKPAMAQRRMNPADMAQRQLQQIEKIIPTLNQQQKDQLQKIFTAHSDSVSKVFSNQNLDRQERFNQMRVMRTQLQNQIKTVLTADQFKVYEDNLAKMRERRRRN